MIYESSRNNCPRYLCLLHNHEPPNFIVNSFKTCGLSNDLNGTEDDLIWKGVVSGDEPAIVLPEDVCEDDESL